MKLQSYIKKIDTKEVITCILLIVVGYMTAKLFMRKYNGFRVGGQNSCPLGSDLSCKLGTYPQRSGGGAPSPDPCSKVKADDCNKSWWQSKSNGAGNKPIGVACKYVKDKCITPGTGFKNINGCPTKSCDGSANSPSPPPSAGKTPPAPTTGPPPAPGTPTVSCSFTGSFDTGVCYLNKKIIDPTDSKYDSECQDCQWYSRWQFYVLSICIIFGCGILGGVIGYDSGKYISYGFGGLFAGIVITVITGLVINYTVGTLTTNKTQN